MVYVSSVHDERWLADVIGTYLDGEDYSDLSFGSALIDTGSSFVHVSSSLYNKLIDNYVKDVCKYEYREYFCPCDAAVLNEKLPIIKFYIRGGILELKPEDYIFN